MTNDELRTAIETLWPGHGAQTKAANAVQISSRRIREYISGERAVPQWLADEIGGLLQMFPEGVKDIDPTKSIAVLQQQMTGAGWTPAEAAVAIVSAAAANAKTYAPEATVTRFAGHNDGAGYDG